MAEGFNINSGGFTLAQPLNCDDTPGSGDAWTKRCRAKAADAARGGKMATIEIQLFDQDANFTQFTAALTAQMHALNQTWLTEDQPNFSLKDRATGQVNKLPTDCQQALGNQDSLAVCEVLLTPRILMITTVAPQVPSTQSVSASPDPNNQTKADVNHNIAFTGVVEGQLRPILP